MSENEKNAEIFCDAILEFSKKSENLENLRAYLSLHFAEWMKKYAYDPENLSCEMREFANMEI